MDKPKPRRRYGSAPCPYCGELVFNNGYARSAHYKACERKAQQIRQSVIEVFGMAPTTPNDRLLDLLKTGKR